MSGRKIVFASWRHSDLGPGGHSRLRNHRSSAQDIRAGWMQFGWSRGAEGQGFQENADELLHGSYLVAAKGKETDATLTLGRPTEP